MNSIFINISYLIFIMTLLFLFAVNIYTVDFETNERVIQYFEIMYVSILMLLSIVLSQKITKLTDRIFFFAFVGFSLLLIYSTSINHSVIVGSQLNINKIAQLVVIFSFSYLAFLAGRNFPLNNDKMIRYVTLLLSIFGGVAIYITLSDEYFYLHRPFSWSFYFLVFFTIWFVYIEKSKINTIILLLIAVMILLSGSRSALIAFVGILFFQIKKNYIFYIISIVGLLVWTFTMNLDFENLRIVSHGLETNRTEVWSKVMELIIQQENYWIGNGVYAFDFNVNNYESITIPHNTYLLLFLYGGGIGTVLGLMMVGYVMVKLFKTHLGLVIVLPIIMYVNDLQLFPTSYSRIFENILFYFMIGILLKDSFLKSTKYIRREKV